LRIAKKGSAIKKRAEYLQFLPIAHCLLPIVKGTQKQGVAVMTGKPQDQAGVGETEWRRALFILYRVMM
jgi:hypothetical protein